MDKIRQWAPMKGLDASVITHEAQPTRMSRSGGKGPKGNGFSLTSRAEYGLGVGQDVVHMGRSGGSGPGGKGFSLTHTGPTRMSRKAKGSASHDSTDYGVGGVSGSGGGGYGIGGI